MLAECRSLQTSGSVGQGQESKMTEVATGVAPYLVGERNGFRWFHVEDVKGPALGALAAEFKLHELAVEDCRSSGTRAKLDDYNGHLFLVVNTIHFEQEGNKCWFGEFDIFVGKEFLITVHDGPSRTVALVKPRFMSDPRLAHPARLLHALLGVIVGRYMPVLDTIEERMDAIEDQAYTQPSPHVVAEIFSIKRALVEFRRVGTTMRDVANLLLSRQEPWLRSHQMYFRDSYDQILRALDFVETYRDILTGILDVHLTATANRTNEIMKVLTIFATLATPFLLITSFYGMNFDFLPLLHSPQGAIWATVAMVGLGVLMVWYFKRKGWV
jgi:magnesium transporter